MRLILVILLGISVLFSFSCSEKPAEEVPEAGHTALGTSAPPTINPVRTDSLHYLTEYVGEQPDSVDLWETEPLRSKLEELLGNDFNKFLQYMQQATPLQQERVLYTMSDTVESKNFAFLLVDPETNQLHVSIVEDGIRRQYQAPGEELYLPYPVEQLL